MMAGFAIGVVLGISPEDLRAMQQLLPRGPLEKAGWVAVSLTTGFSEEVIYRGYLLRQFRAFSGSLAAGIFLQAVVYAATHSALPLKIMVSVFLMGLLLGGLAAWRKSLIPAMIMHAGISLVGGLLSPS